MDFKQSEVVLTLNLRGMQATRGCYDDNNGRTLQPVRYCPTKKTVILSNAFVRGALEESPKRLGYRPHVWVKLPAQKRIMLHVKDYVFSQHPEHRGYKAEIL